MTSQPRTSKVTAGVAGAAGNLPPVASVERGMCGNRVLVTVAISILGTLVPSSAWAAVGRLDPSFGTRGRVVTNFSEGTDIASGIAIQPDGRIVVAGTAEWESRFALARYLPDGSLDPAFAAGGKTTTSLTGDLDIALDVAIQPDGKVVVAGTGGFRRFALVRYEEDGTLDPSFGNDGVVLTRLTGRADLAYAVLVQPDGRIVAAGVAGLGGKKRRRQMVGVVRYEPDGRLDTSFGDGGKVLTDLTPRADSARAVVLQPDEKIVVAGRAAGGGGRFAVVRYTAGGDLDPSFGRDGVAFTNFTPKEDSARDLALRPDGRIVVVGRAGGRRADFALARYLPDGRLDRSLGRRGTVTTSFSVGQDLALSVALQDDGKIVTAGHAGGRSPRSRDHRFAFARYRPNGALDPTFRGNGKRVVNFTRWDDWAEDLAIQPDGRIVAAGHAEIGEGRFALVRLTA